MNRIFPHFILQHKQTDAAVIEKLQTSTNSLPKSKLLAQFQPKLHSICRSQCFYYNSYYVGKSIISDCNADQGYCSWGQMGQLQSNNFGPGLYLELPKHFCLMQCLCVLSLHSSSFFFDSTITTQPMVIQQKPSFGFCSPPEKVNFSLKRDFKKETLNFFSLLRYLGLKFKKIFWKLYYQ